jgi:hypothetical protein
MKSIVIFIFFMTTSLGFAQERKEIPKTQILEASCGQC